MAPHAAYHGPMLRGVGGKTAHAWPKMHVQQPFLAAWGNSKLPAARCGVRGTTRVEKSEPAQLFFTWHDSTKLKKAGKCSAFAKNASTRANIGRLGWLGAFGCPMMGCARAPPGWARPRGHGLAKAWFWALHRQKHSAFAKKPSTRANSNRARQLGASGCPWVN